MIISVNPHLLSLWFLKVNIYGLFSVIAVFTFIGLLIFDQRKNKDFDINNFLQIIFEFILVGIISAKILFILVDASNFSFQSLIGLNSYGIVGFSQLGSFIGIPLYAYWRLKQLNINFLTFADLIAYRLPILQAIARIGCLFAGCCAGTYVTSQYWFSVTYTHPNAIAPNNIALLPIQGISIIFSCLIFVMLFFFKKTTLHPGQLFGSYLLGEATSRFITDFWRLEREITLLSMLSTHQVLSIIIAFFGVIFIFAQHKHKK